MTYIILSARSYDFEDDQKKRVQGVTVNYLDGPPETAADRRGIFPMTISADPALWSDLRQLPGVYECDFRQRPGRNNRPTLTLTGVKFVASLSLVSDEKPE